MAVARRSERRTVICRRCEGLMVMRSDPTTACARVRIQEGASHVLSQQSTERSVTHAYH